MDENKVVSGENVAGNEQYIAAIKELKDNTVSKEDFLKLKKENKQLLDTLVSGQTIEQPKEAPAKPTIKELTSHLMEEGLTNLEYVQTSLELRQRVLEEEGRDMYCPVGTQYSPTKEDIESAKHVAEELQEMVDLADGSSEIFNAEFQRRTQDVTFRRK